ncbi:Putative Zn-dependent peptidase [Ignavibacterium album JCM 16511]|uniref:Putative Zn-dependent peptidase n=1 Tax=Ignavibacterium album (strain DSM 19864 / JCM 16511 / NBRC 101810 / Mat9-16) TaxID=945713 RepID=I0AG82_IGNAJ|nr:pitrilysin family protein [Ignavibacterium album]AFH47989.1 Putative Zn-dependent peptidase [Ignavibacterium album JCM 16511]
MFSQKISLVALLSLFTIASFPQSAEKFKLDYEKYKLSNGLEVILHEDKSDPIVSVTILYHVGSNREKPGKTGFAHLFEHMMFQESQHVGQDKFFKYIQENGGTLNGGTWQDGTIYYQIVPKNALELVLWLESDRMGYLLPTVTQEAFLNQQEVVQNEKRQRVDNQPYGHTSYVINKLLYPTGHPYSWEVIGELIDLQNATVKDVHDFYRTWYGPNNATLVVAGDFDKSETKKLIEKYFGELKPSDPVTDLKPMPVELKEIKKAFYEDKFAQSPELNMVFPTVEQYNKDGYALDVLADLLAKGKRSPFYKVIVEEKKLAPSVSVFQNSSELAGDFRIRIRTFPDKNLTEVEKAIFEALEKFEKDGFTDKDLERIKAGIETNFYNQIASVLGKSFQLAQYNEYAGSPDFISEDLKNSLAVTKEDVWRVYNKYIKNKNYVLTSFVPAGKTDLIAAQSEKFVVPEEQIKPLNEEEIKVRNSNPDNQVKVDPIPSSFDRNIVPALGADPLINVPKVWDAKLKNGIKIYGIEYNELPLFDFQIEIKGGLLQDEMNKVGVANLTARMLTQGTKNKTPIELEDAIEELGARINVSATNESIVLQANCLSSKFNEVYKLTEEILLEPRWDEKEFARLKQETLETIRRGKSNPAAVASNVFNKLIYGDDHIFSKSILGTEESVNAITLDDLKDYYQKNIAPQLASISFAGNIKKDEVVKAFSSLEKRWNEKPVKIKTYPEPIMTDKSVVYFIDFPNAKQSEIRIGHLGINYTHPDYFKAYVMNYKLGGSFNGIVNLILREEKGFTYGARTDFRGTELPGYFVAAAAVQTNATLESAQIFRDEIVKYRNGISEEDMNFTKNSLLKSNALRFETLGALRGMLSQIAKYNLPFDYVKNQEKQIQNMTIEEHKKLAEKYLQPDKMIYLIVGDKATQYDKLKELGLGDPILLDKDGNVIK